jgi:sulfofructosephosphate aldolase
MVALDQRESLRTMMATDRGIEPAAVPDADLARFKLAAMRTLAPLATGVLIDRHYVLDQVLADPPACGLIVAVDRLVQPPGKAVEDTYLDEDVDVRTLASAGVAALKLLVIWREDGQRERRLAMAAEFVRRCASAGLASVLEAVVRPGDPELIVAATGVLTALRPSIYKVQVPLAGKGNIGPWCEKINDASEVPWVVLSQGVEMADFPSAVRAACAAGASGFLAGRAIWRDCVTDLAALDTRARDRLAGLRVCARLR